MKLFKRKKTGKPVTSGVRCPECGSDATFPGVPADGSATVSVKTWRGKSYVERHCLDCGSTFYADVQNSDGTDIPGEDIDDEEALRLAEEELKRAADEDGDHRYH